MIDPRISLAVQTPSVGQAINVFDNAIVSNQNRKLRASQEARAAELQPFRNQILQQQVQSGQASLDDASTQRILKSINDFALSNQTSITRAEQGDTEGLLTALLKRRDGLIQGNENTDQTDEAILMLGQGDVAGVVGGLKDSVNLFQQQQGRTADQRRIADIKRDLQGAIDPTTGQLIDESKMTAIQRIAAIDAKLISGAGTLTSAERLGADEEKTKGVAKSKKTIAQAEAFGRATGVNRVNRIDKGFEAVTKIDKNIANLEKSIAAIKEGASSGPFTKLLPTFRTATKELEQIQGELALDVVGSVAFGALSEGELNLAKQIGLPDLPPEDLKDWALRKIAAQKKVKAEMLRQIQHLDEGGSIASYFRLRTKEFEQNQRKAPPVDFGGFKLLSVE